MQYFEGPHPSPSTPLLTKERGWGSQEKHHVPWMCKWRSEVLTLIGLNRKTLYHVRQKNRPKRQSARRSQNQINALVTSLQSQHDIHKFDLPDII